MSSNCFAVIGCGSMYDDKHTIGHRFPKDKETSDIWVQRIGNNNLLKSVQLIFKLYVMCDKHFEDSCIPTIPVVYLL